MSGKAGVLAGLRADVAYLNEVNGGGKSPVYLWLASSGIRCATLMRIAARGGVIGRLARFRLLAAYSSDVSPGAAIDGGISLPHPTGIVIGIGVRIEGRCWIYQGVTLGANARGEYPIIEHDVKLYPNSVVTGRVTVGTGATIGAGAYIYDDVPAGATVRGPRTGTA